MGVSVAVVGGGAAGTLVAVHLLRAGAPVDVTVIERSERVARGVAYSTTFPDHLLNVVAANMGGPADEPGHFRSWLAEYRQPVRATSFMPRGAYGDYLAHLLEQSIAAAPQGAFQRVRGEAVGVSRAGDRWVVRLADGGQVECDRLVLATGVPAPRDPPLQEGAWPVDSPLYLSDPWTPAGLEGLAPGDNLLLVGTGLTMVDIAPSADRPASRRPHRCHLAQRPGAAAASVAGSAGGDRLPAAGAGDAAQGSAAGISGGHQDLVRPRW